MAGWFLQANWKRHIHAATVKANQHWRELCQSRAFAGVFSRVFGMWLESFVRSRLVWLTCVRVLFFRPQFLSSCRTVSCFSPALHPPVDVYFPVLLRHSRLALLLVPGEAEAWPCVDHFGEVSGEDNPPQLAEACPGAVSPLRISLTLRHFFLQGVTETQWTEFEEYYKLTTYSTTIQVEPPVRITRGLRISVCAFRLGGEARLEEGLPWV